MLLHAQASIAVCEPDIGLLSPYTQLISSQTVDHH